jgi:hypothetical protein
VSARAVRNIDSAEDFTAQAIIKESKLPVKSRGYYSIEVTGNVFENLSWLWEKGLKKEGLHICPRLS